METVALVCGLCAAAWALRTPAPPPHRDVLTGAGTVRGYLASRPPHFAFLGVPYARSPPRFKGPEAPVQWGGVLEATHRVRCAQPGTGRRADPACLVLNVFVPIVPEPARRLPVLVHLHKGNFAIGWGSHRASSRLLAEGFVVVTLNYRLGAEGFLCLGTSDAPGNAGLKDQVSALSWVHTNIEKFGGDPSQVTLYGTGAGAASAELLLLSGAIDGFIQRVILESGTALAPTSLTYDPAAAALEVAKALGYEGDEAGTPHDLATFYQDIAMERTLNFSNRFTPCVEDVSDYNSALIIKDPKAILQSGIFKPVPLLIAYIKEKTALNGDLFHNLPDDFQELLPNNLEFRSLDAKIKISEQVKESYFGQPDTHNAAEGFESYINDVFTVYPTVKSAALHSAAGSAPVYLMEYVPGDGGDTIFDYIFGRDILSEEEELVCETLKDLWSNFMKYSDPTPLVTSFLPVLWSPVTVRVRNEKPDISTALCFIFDHGQMSMGVPSSGDSLTIWDHIYDNFYKDYTPPLEEESALQMYEEEIALFSILSKQETQNKENNENGNTGDQIDDESHYEGIGNAENDESIKEDDEGSNNENEGSDNKEYDEKNEEYDRGYSNKEYDNRDDGSDGKYENDAGENLNN